ANWIDSDSTGGTSHNVPLGEVAGVRSCRRDDRVDHYNPRTSFVAVHLSAFGTKRTSAGVCYLSAFGGKADINPRQRPRHRSSRSHLRAKESHRRSRATKSAFVNGSVAALAI